MTGVDLAALRALAEKNGVVIMGDGNPSIVMASWSDVLALVEAVEAAHRLCAVHAQIGNYHPAWDDMRAALAAFRQEQP